ncbi:MAG: hypothetical protein QNJ63_11210 [Calothrix sp. MO_192.B10]|nr:hypothetical protein [Calothrix sp. MO_192.B10]
MPKPADTSTKKLISLAPNNWDVEELKGILRIVITANTIDDLQQSKPRRDGRGLCW